VIMPKRTIDLLRELYEEYTLMAGSSQNGEEADEDLIKEVEERLNIKP